jgi:hypothetical protein
MTRSELRLPLRALWCSSGWPGASSGPRDQPATHRRRGHMDLGLHLNRALRGASATSSLARSMVR